MKTVGTILLGPRRFPISVKCARIGASVFLTILAYLEVLGCPELAIKLFHISKVLPHVDIPYVDIVLAKSSLGFGQNKLFGQLQSGD